MKTTIFAAVAAMTLTACGTNDFDINDAVVRQGPQTQSPIADAPGGKLPEGGASASTSTTVVIDDSGTAASSGSIFEFQG